MRDNTAKYRERVIEAALALAEPELVLKAMRRETRPCEYRERPQPEVGDSGVPPCDINDSEADLCEACKLRLANRQHYQDAMKARARAKARLIRWAAKLIEVSR